jgi:hypothetical protein
MADIPVEQALYVRQRSEPPRLTARSPGFREDWLAEAEWLVTAFGDRPPGLSCPAAVFAYPFGKKHVAVAHVADQAVAEGRSAPLGFHLLILPRPAYARYLGDPFMVAERFPPVWSAQGTLPELSLPAVPLPPRSVADVRRVLQRVKSGALLEDEEVSEAGEIQRTTENSVSPALLGGVQVLVDGGKLAFERPAPDAELVRGLWTLLPTANRGQLWPASFAFGNGLEFDALVTPRARPADFPGYTTEDQAADYPEGRYELNLQMAAEAGDQRELDMLLSRRTWGETWKLALTLVVLMSFLALAAHFLQMPERPARVDEVRNKQAAVAASVIAMQDPWCTLTVLPPAQKAWNDLTKQVE